MTKKSKITMFLFAVFVLALYYFVRYSEFMQIDRCLDRGGAWNYDQHRCEFWYQKEGDLR